MLKIRHWQDRDTRGKFSSFKAKFKRFIRKTFIVGIAVATLVGTFELGGLMSPVVKAQLVKEGIAPVLERIYKCESQGKQYGKSGQVLMNANTNGTVDIGVGQINTVWFSKATELGYDLTKEEDNRAMAEFIYKNHGTSPWSSSVKCWK